MPPNGGIVRPENVQMKPFFPKSNLNTTLNGRVPGGMVGSNSLPSGHTDLNRHHPCQPEDFFQGVMIVEVFSTSFNPQVVQNKAHEYVEGLSSVRVATGIVREESGCVIVELSGRFADERKRPGDL